MIKGCYEIVYGESRNTIGFNTLVSRRLRLVSALTAQGAPNKSLFRYNKVRQYMQPMYAFKWSAALVAIALDRLRAFAAKFDKYKEEHYRLLQKQDGPLHDL